MKVLIVEDDNQLNLTLTRYFEKTDFKVITAKDGLSAIEHIDTLNFDLFIIDINIPNINGLELISHIRKTDINTPIIVITAALEIENFTAAFENGCSEYIKKPFHLKELEIRVNRLLNINQPTKIIHFFDDFKYDQKQNKFFYNNEPVKLRYKEKDLYRY